jgi:hypothetical protein
LDELKSLLTPDRCLVVYHHQTRIGALQDQIKRCRKRLKDSIEELFSVDSLRVSAGTARIFLLLNASKEIQERAAHLAGKWEHKGKKRIWWHADPDPRNLAKSVTVE